MCQAWQRMLLRAGCRTVDASMEGPGANVHIDSQGFVADWLIGKTDYLSLDYDQIRQLIYV
jgi:hypothetical protein